VTVESGAFTVTSTVGGASSSELDGGDIKAGSQCGSSSKAIVPGPFPRFGSLMTVKQGILYLFGGTIEDGDVTYTLKDLYSIGKGLLMWYGQFSRRLCSLQTFTNSTSGRFWWSPTSSPWTG